MHSLVCVSVSPTLLLCYYFLLENLFAPQFKASDRPRLSFEPRIDHSVESRPQARSSQNPPPASRVLHRIRPKWQAYETQHFGDASPWLSISMKKKLAHIKPTAQSHQYPPDLQSSSIRMWNTKPTSFPFISFCHSHVSLRAILLSFTNGMIVSRDTWLERNRKKRSRMVCIGWSISLSLVIIIAAVVLVVLWMKGSLIPHAPPPASATPSPTSSPNSPI
jgi:hypothetical protein